MLNAALDVKLQTVRAQVAKSIHRALTPDVPILMYHHITPSDYANDQYYEIPVALFEAQLDWLQGWGFQTISFDGLVEALRAGRRLPRRAVLITFDDAFTSFLELALPALLKRGMRATIFAPGGYLGATNVWDRARGLPERSIMTAKQLCCCAAEGIEVGSHGWLHRDLTLSNHSEIEEEMVRSKTHLEGITQQPIHAFSYPYGHYQRQHIHQLQTAGYRAATSIFSDEETVTSNLFAMRRIYIHAEDTLVRFRAKVSRLYLRYLGWRRTSH